jgi:hypothetical protein
MVGWAVHEDDKKALMDGWKPSNKSRNIIFRISFVRADGSVVAMEQAIPERNIK